MEEVEVRLGSRSYPITVGDGVFSRLGQVVRDHAPRSSMVFIVTDDRVATHHLGRAIQYIAASGYRAVPFVIPSGEASKTLSQATTIYDALIKNGFDRGSPIVALGGGVVGDLAGFVAATYMRGVPLIQVPTSVVAQVDSSVGGKTAVNHPLGKNLIGAFYQPRAVLIDVALLSTLPERDYRAGLAEVIKYGAIRDEKLLAFIEEHLERVHELRGDELIYLVSRCCRIKAEIVEQDEREDGLRAVLNFGHTLGHAIETLTGYEEFRHGEAVAVGMAFAARHSVRMGLLSEGDRRRFQAILKGVGLPTAPPPFPVESYMEAVKQDKKGVAGAVSFVLTGPLGHVSLHPMEISEIFSIWSGF